MPLTTIDNSNSQETPFSRRELLRIGGAGVMGISLAKLLPALASCLAGLVISVMLWALAHHQGNYSQVSSGKTGVLVAAGGALLIGGANAIIGFFSTLGGGIR